jgi:UDP-N-acetylmuramoylalanine--D-glutamate ligase
MSNWNGQKVVILGAARQGTALTRYLVQHGAQVVLNDQRQSHELQSAQQDLAGLPVQWVFGGHPLSLLDGTDLLCLSGGVPLDNPLVVEAQKHGIPLSNDSQIFIETAPCRVIGITGSAGKTTTTTLVGRMAQKAVEGTPRRAWIGGNIGFPLIAVVDEMRVDDLAILELSSFQTEIMTRSPHIAVILNITPNHLDRHGTMEAYTAAKVRLLEFQTGEDIAVLGRDNLGAWQLARKVKGRLFSFGLSEMLSEGYGTFITGDKIFFKGLLLAQPLMDRSIIQLRGNHNLLNVLAAFTIAAAANLPPAAMQAGVEGFSGVPHRLEFVRSWKRTNWYNDSIATTPERAIASLSSFHENLVLLAGGRDKHLPWDKFAAMVRQRVDHLIVFGEMADMIMQVVSATNSSTKRPYTLQRCAGLKEAVQAAAQIAEPGDVILLSPGGTSFDEFKDFEERGERFRRWVNDLS